MRPPLHLIEWPGPGRLATMARPPGAEQLPGAMAALAGTGVHILVSALSEHETVLLDLVDEPAAARQAGLELIWFPILDGHVPEPETMPALEKLVDRLADEMRADRFVVTHCFAGIGRCSMLAGATLVRLGLSPDKAWRLIRAARHAPVPDSPRQESWLYDFAGR